MALEHVRARYPGQPRPAVDDVSLRLEPGERVALVGPSGAGKTTVVNLLLRFLDPELGRVTLAGRDLRDYRQDDVRHVIAVAGQDSHLFSASIRRQRAPRLGREATEDEVEQALRRARIWDWVCPASRWARHAGRRGRMRAVRAASGSGSSWRGRSWPARRYSCSTNRPPIWTQRPLPIWSADVFAAAGGQTVLLITHRSEGLDLVDRVVSL